MVFFTQLLLAVCFAVLFTLIFSVGLRRPGPWSSLLVFFTIVFLASWAAAVWVPVGPLLFGIYWLPIVVVAFFFALLLGAAMPPRPRAGRVQTATEVRDQDERTERACDFLFWVLIVGFTALIVFGYLAGRSATT
jgi:hypothetical protein